VRPPSSALRRRRSGSALEGVHRPPRQRDLAGEDRRALGRRDVLPGAARRVAIAGDDLEPGSLAVAGAVVVGLSTPSAKSASGK